LAAAARVGGGGVGASWGGTVASPVLLAVALARARRVDCRREGDSEARWWWWGRTGLGRKRKEKVNGKRGNSVESGSGVEFLTQETSCPIEMSKRTTFEKKLIKKTTSEWRHPWPDDTWHMPPGPKPARGCRRWQHRQVVCR
jgi:hypothetical protein